MPLSSHPEITELFITLSSVSFNKGSACLSSFVEMGRSSHVDDLDEEIRKVSSGRSMGVVLRIL